MKTLHFLLVVSLFMDPNSLFAQPGSLDSDFDADGRLTTTISSNWDEIFSVLVQPDSKILVAGYTNVGTHTDVALARYLPDGTLDNTFSFDGKVVTSVGNADDYGLDMLLQNDNKILVGGFADDNTLSHDFSILRYNNDGTLDVNFGNNGKVLADFANSSDKCYSIALQNDGKIIAAGSTGSSQQDIALLRLNTDGSLDNTFSFDGKVTTDFWGDADFCYSVAVQADGKIVVVGKSKKNFVDVMIVARYNTDGTLDPSFDTDGKLDFWIGPNQGDILKKILIQQDGKLLLAGYSYINVANYFALARLEADGSFDTTFGNNGKYTSGFGSGSAECYDMALQPDGRILAAGASNAGVNSFDFALLRLNPDGTPDITFDTDGRVLTDFTGNSEWCNAVCLQPDGRIVTAGTALVSGNNDFAVARYISGLNIGLIDFSSADFGWLIYPNPVGSVAVLEYELLKEEDISISLFDMQGRLLKSYCLNQVRKRGAQREEIKFDNTIPSGEYLLRISNGITFQTVKIIKL